MHTSVLIFVFSNDVLDLEKFSYHIPDDWNDVSSHLENYENANIEVESFLIY